jgi:hypothetical protein
VRLMRPLIQSLAVNEIVLLYEFDDFWFDVFPLNRCWARRVSGLAGVKYP